jgi:mono/diheme cytochrome c family protein
MVVLAATIAVAACSGADGDEVGSPAGTPSTDVAASTPSSDGGATATDGGEADPSASTGLPCDVEMLITARCAGCHQGPSPVKLLTYDDLVATSSDPKKTLAQLSLERMKDGKNPMPPKPTTAATAEEIAVLQRWISAGYPRDGECMDVDGGKGGKKDDGKGGKGGKKDAGGADVPPVTCTSNVFWQEGNKGSGTMSPGSACLSCHENQRGVRKLAVAGTVYPTANEPDDCFGLGGVSVVVTDLQGKVQATLTTNEAGNFFVEKGVKAPFKVKVVRGGAERAMVATLGPGDGDCNGCHTRDGANGAPGRIMAP